MPMKEIAAMLAGIDVDNSGRIDYAEFVSVMTSDKAAKRAEAQGSAQKPHKPHLFNLKVIHSCFTRSSKACTIVCLTLAKLYLVCIGVSFP